MMDRRHFRRDTDMTPPPGLVVAEFANGHMALEFIKVCLDKTYTVTAGINLPFAVRKRIPESVAGTPSGADADPQVQPPYGPAGGFSITALTPKGARMLPEIECVLGRMEIES